MSTTKEKPQTLDQLLEQVKALATIHSGLKIMKEIVTEMANKSPIEKMIDEVTGRNKDRDETVIMIMTDVIEAKKILGESTEMDEIILSKYQEARKIKEESGI